MTQACTARSTSQQGLAWLLLIAVALMGLTITRQQALGSLHWHADHGVGMHSTLGSVFSSLAKDWSGRWQQQKVLGHGQLLLAAPSFPSPSPSPTPSQTHDHDSLERHHHAPHDVGVVALDGAAEFADGADNPASGASVLLPALGTAGSGLAWLKSAVHRGPWPVGQAVDFASRSIPPPLRPPAAL